MKFTLFTAVLFSVWMNAADGEGREPDCCLTVKNTRIPVQNIVDYTIQESSHICAVRAVKFLTRKGKYICSDPDDSWAIRAINDVNCRKNKEPCVKPKSSFTRTTNMISTTTNKTPVTETEISTSTTEPPKVTRIDTSEPKTETSESTTDDHPDCCLTVTNTRVPVQNIVDYTIQESSHICAVRAVK
ncbi:hypothetical protein ABG768_012500 [Culter alburnus]|uniref:Chemokine interleukin-8-like domain-containing protein n=1 Tax=Culter alburnus TaxID=194366 RepID=A0AAW2B2K1_CULAL